VLHLAADEDQGKVTDDPFPLHPNISMERQNRGFRCGIIQNESVVITGCPADMAYIFFPLGVQVWSKANLDQVRDLTEIIAQLHWTYARIERGKFWHLFILHLCIQHHFEKLTHLLAKRNGTTSKSLCGNPGGATPSVNRKLRRT
jgi:hypothetical protein